MPTLPKVSRGYDFFLNENGSEFYYVGASEFALWKRWNMDSGPEALVRPILVQRRQVAERAGYSGPIVNRVFRYSDPGNVFGTLPYETDMNQINPFLDMCAEYNMYVDWTCGDSQKPYMIPHPVDQQNHLNQFTSHIQRFCFVETCNEPFKNGRLPQNGVKSAPSEWYIRDSGNYTDISDEHPWEYQYDLDFISYHGTRSSSPGPRFPKWLYDMSAQASTLRTFVGRPSVLKEPIGFDKTFQPGRRYNDPYLAKLLGHIVAQCGVCFHSQIGLQTDGYDPETENAAYNYYLGISGALKQ